MGESPISTADSISARELSHLSPSTSLTGSLGSRFRPQSLTASLSLAESLSRTSTESLHTSAAQSCRSDLGSDVFNEGV